MALRRVISEIQPPAKYLSHKAIALPVKVIDKCVPDRVLLFSINMLDKRVPPRVISIVVDGVGGHLPSKIRSGMITVADEYVPDAVANSRKVCAVLAGLGKYIPDRIIPPESAERWENVKLKFHIPTLIGGSRPRRSSAN